MSTNNFTTVVSRADNKIMNAYEALTDKQAPINVIGDTVPIAALTITQRKGLLRGPTADIFVGDKLAYRDAPIRALMAWSSKMNAHFVDNPLARTVTIHKADITAVQSVLKATITMSGMGGDVISWVRKGATLEQLILTYQAGLSLGMDGRVKYHCNYLKNLISEDLISYEALNLIVDNVPANDCVFEHLAHNLAYHRFKRIIPDAQEFEAWLENHKVLKEAMGRADAPHKAVREAARVAKAQHEWRQQMAKEKRGEAAYRARVTALKKKINAAQGTIVSLTQEEAELRRELGI